MSRRITLAATIAALALATAGAEARAPRMGLEMDPNGVAKRLGPDEAHRPVLEMTLYQPDRLSSSRFARLRA